MVLRIQDLARTGPERWTVREVRPPADAASDRGRWVIAGRRAGKSRAAALLAVFVAAFKTHNVAPGEQLHAIVVAPDRKQAAITLRYVRGFFESVPALSRLVLRETQDTIELSTGIAISVVTADYRLTRGRGAAIIVIEEAAFLDPADSVTSDVELVRSLRPAMATVPGALLVVLSSPYSRSGVLWEAWKEHYGKDNDPVLVVQAATETLNPTIDRQIVADAYREDPEAAKAEYGGLFRNDIESLFTEPALDAVTVRGRLELPFRPGVSYRAFCDPSGGSGDSMTLAISHAELAVGVLDLIREVRPPFSPEDTVRDFCDVMSSYAVSKVTGDRYGGEWPREQFRKHGVDYIISERSKSELYSSLLPAINSRRVELLDDVRLRAQLLGLERRTGRSGRDSIDHGPRGFDDLVNAAAGALLQSSAGRLVLPAEFDTCWHEVNHGRNMAAYGGCFVFQNGGMYLPSGDPSCSGCPAWLYVKAAYADHVARGGDRIGVRDFHQRYVGLNQWAWIRRESWELKQIL